jgi:hypothetical protein
VTHTDEPALEDEFTAQRLAVSVRQARVSMLCWVILLVWAAASCLALVAPVLAGVAVPAGQLALPLVVATFWRVGTRIEPSAVEWRPVLGQLLAEQRWRETPALVLNLRGTVLALPGGEYIRVSGLPQTVREMVVRARRVWVVGPDAAGRLAVRVDGMYVPWPARRVPPPRATAALPTDDSIVAMWMRLHLPPARAVFTVIGALTLLRVAVTAIPPWRWWDILVTVAYVLALVPCWSWLRYFARLRHSGPWVRADAEIQSWQARRNGLANGTVALRFPDGRRFTAQFDKAPVDLFANVAHDRVLWVSDNGVVGYPYYAVLAAARLTPQS